MINVVMIIGHFDEKNFVENVFGTINVKSCS